MTWAHISGTAENMGNFQQTLVLMAIGGTIVLIVLLVIWNVVSNRAGATGDGRVDASAFLDEEADSTAAPGEAAEEPTLRTESHP